jgi:trimethyllysine dioxygenase
LRIAFIRHTHYGTASLVFDLTALIATTGGFYDFTSDLAKGDTAYTQLGIGPHTDNTYFTDPAGLQMFHLLSHTDGAEPAEGGASQLVDGFGAAAALHAADPGAYETLATVPVAAHASGGDELSVQPAAAMPVLVHDAQAGFLVQVRWNTADRAAVDAPMEEIGRWYDAAR